MENFTPITAIIGGLCIGLSATLLLWFNGRIAGISGIFYSAFDGAHQDASTDKFWQWWFLIGLVFGAGIYVWFWPLPFVPRTGFPNTLVIIAGLLVGFGTRMGSGCTSGHGVCGLSRLSKRSFAATIVFMFMAMLTVYIFRHKMELY